MENALEAALNAQEAGTSQDVDTSTPAETGPSFSDADIKTYFEQNPQARDAHLHEYLVSKDHEELKQYPAYNRSLQSVLDRERAQRNKERQEQLSRHQRMQDLQSRIAPYEAAGQEAAFRQLMSQPGAAEAYSELQKWRHDGGPLGITEGDVASAMVGRLKDRLNEHPMGKHILDKWEDIFQSDTLDGLWKMVELATESYKRELQESLTKENEAKLTELAMKRGLASPTPDQPKGGTAVKTTVDLATLNQMSKADRDAYEREHKADIELALRRELGLS